MKIGQTIKGKKIGYKHNSYSDMYIWSACPDCGKERWVRLYRGEPTSIRCNSCSNRGKNNPNWRGGKTKHEDGYIFVYLESVSPYSMMRNYKGYVFKHRLVMAQHLKRPLTKVEVVHHIDGIKDNNRIENLKLFKNDFEHLAHHRKLKRMENMRICGLCKFYDSEYCFCSRHLNWGEMVEQDSCDDWSEDETTT